MEAVGTVAQNASSPVFSVMRGALKWSRTMEEPTKASSISSRSCISCRVMRAMVSV